MAEQLPVRARLALAATAREVADLSRHVLGDVSTVMVTGERIRTARRVRLQALALVDRAVLTELADGATWAEVAESVGLPEATVRETYGPTWALWLDGDLDDDADFGDRGVGLPGDVDVEGTAASLDLWWRRHAEPWETFGDDGNPVARVVARGEHQA